MGAVKDNGKGKGKALTRTGHESPEGEQMYSSTLPSTSALDGGVGGQGNVPGDLPTGNTRDPLYGRLGGPQGGFVRMRKYSPSPRFDLMTVRPVASC